jgi:DNA-binding transcriptional MocR family regulator
LLDAIKTHLLPLGVKTAQTAPNGVFGGYFIWLQLPEGVSANILAARAKEEEEVIVAPGSLFEVARDNESNGKRFWSGVRLCFAWEEEDRLQEGVKKVARVLKSMLEDVTEKSKRHGRTVEENEAKGDGASKFW